MILQLDFFFLIFSVNTTISAKNFLVRNLFV